MLCQFSFQNYKSYKNETTLDFQAATLPEFRESLITEENACNLLPVSVVYGPNGGGKSNLLLALSCVISAIVKPIHDLEKNHQSLILQQEVDVVPFLFDQTSADEPTCFRLFFRVAKNEYCYFISVKNEEILSESLHRKALTGKKSATIFERKVNVITLGSSVNKKGISTSVNPKMPYLSFLAINYDLPVINEAMTWFEGCIIRNYSCPTVDDQAVLTASAAYKNQFIHALNDMNIDIIEYRYDEEKHQFYMKRSLDGSEYELPFSEESDGTKKLIAALPILLLALHEGRMVIIDELDAKLHPKLLKYIISLFKNREINRLGAQLLFTSHDMYTLKSTVFRRDEIWFAAENKAHESEIYSLHEIRDEDNDRVKSTAAYDKQYMEGRYGADPYLTNMLGGDF